MTAKTVRMGPAMAIANHLGWDVSEVRDSRYHRGHTGTLQLFSVGDGYMTATRGKAKPPKVEGYDMYQWEDANSWVFETYGWTIWVCIP